MTIAIFLFCLLGAMMIGMPIAYALIACAVALMYHLNMMDAQIIAQNFINGADSFPLMAIPFFMLAGEVMNTGGLSKRIVNVALNMVGHIKGGLGYVAVLASCFLAAVSGSAIADAAAVSALLFPMMAAAGYNKERSAGLIAAANIVGPIIPPSTGFVVFGVIAGVSITKLFLAGIVPGLMVGAAVAIAWAITVRRENVQPAPRVPFKEVALSVYRGVWALVLPLIILFGLKLGVFTPTEAAVVAAVYSLFVACFIYRELKFSQLYAVFLSAGKTTAVVMFLVAAAMVSAWLIAVAELPDKIVDLMHPFAGNQTALMFAMMALVVIVGTALDMAPTILILTPVLMPIVKDAGIDPIYFGVLFIINNAIGLITPPVGTVLNVVSGITKVKMDGLIRGVWPFLLAQLLVLLALILFPQLVTVPAKWFGA